MNEVQLKIDENKRGEFVVEENGESLGTMKVHLEEKNLVVDGTVVEPAARGKNLGKKLIEAMVHHARLNDFKVIPHCPFVRGQFKKYPEEYGDLWEKSE